MSDTKNKSFRTALGKVRGAGSAKSGTRQWIMMRLTAVALLLLAIYPLFGFFIYAVYGGRAGALHWLHSPFGAAGTILFLIAGFSHAAGGLQEVIEDYVHCHCAKTISLYAVKFIAAALAVTGILATVKIMLGA